MEKILCIEEFDEGFHVITDKQTIEVGISMDSCCCEDFGYFMSNDDFSDFIGADLYSIAQVDSCLRVTELPEYGMESGDTMFINFNTSKGVLQFTAYNSHNGYYGHDAWVKATQLTLNTIL